MDKKRHLDKRDAEWRDEPNHLVQAPETVASLT